jgi:hypothetical protein
MLSAGALERYRTDGFLFCPAVLQPVQVAAALAAVDFAYDQPMDAINLRPDGGGSHWMRQRTYQWCGSPPPILLSCVSITSK